MKKEKRELGIIKIDYPFNGFILVNGPRKDLGEFKEELLEDEVCRRSEVLLEKLSSIENNLVFPGSMGFHCSGDFIVESVEPMSAHEIRLCHIPASWGEKWSIGS